MSTYNNKMIESSLSPYGSRDLVARDSFLPPYSFNRREIEVNDGAMWRQVVRILRRHWKTSLAFLALLEFAVALLVFSMQNTYVAKSVLDVEPPGADTIGLENTASASAANTPGYLDTQTEILNSDGLALSVIDQLHLDQNPAFLKQTLWQKTITWLAEWLPSKNKVPRQRDTDKLLNIFHAGMKVGQVKGSQLVEVQYESNDPQLAAQLVNATVNQYLDMTYRSRYEATIRAAKSLSPRLADLQNSVKQSTEALLDFQKKHEGAELGSVSPVANDGTTNFAAPRAAILCRNASRGIEPAIDASDGRPPSTRIVYEADSTGKCRFPAPNEGQRFNSRIDFAPGGQPGAAAEAPAIYGSNNPQVRKMEQESEEISKQLDAERTRIANQIKSAYASAQNREQLIRNTLHGMKGELDQSNTDIVQYDALKREADADANLYTTLSSRTKEIALSGSLSSSNIRLLDEARPPLKPDGPHRFRILGVGALFGIFGGVILAFAAEQMNDTISSAEDFRRWSGLPTLALVPQISVPGGRGRLASGKPTRMIAAKSMASIRINGLKFLTENPNSPEAEAIRNLETSIRIPLSSNRPAVQTILITSALPAEGKTTVATNLSLALSRHGKTCLIDGDFRHPSITSSFGLTLRIGLQDLLTNPAHSPEEALKPLAEVPNLTVLGVGKRAPNSLECLTSPRMMDLISELRKKFDYIVLDSPPIIPFSEGRWLSTLSDASIVVARCDSTTRGAVMFSLEILENLKATVLGVVLNGVDLKEVSTTPTE